MRVVLICTAGSRVNREVLARFVASRFELVGIVAVQDRIRDRLKRIRNEWRRSRLGLIDVVAMRLYYRVVLARRDRIGDHVDALLERFPPIGDVPVLRTSDVNRAETAAFVGSLDADVGLVACKRILSREVFDVPRHGTFVVHPGIVPEYRNSYGCFWALVRRDLDRVGASLIQIDDGVDTGLVYGYYTAPFDERSESHIAIQHRVVYENLEQIALDLEHAVDGSRRPLDTNGRDSIAWGQARLTDYLRWKRAARRSNAPATCRPGWAASLRTAALAALAALRRS